MSSLHRSSGSDLHTLLISFALNLGLNQRRLDLAPRVIQRLACINSCLDPAPPANAFHNICYETRLDARTTVALGEAVCKADWRSMWILLEASAAQEEIYILFLTLLTIIIPICLSESQELFQSSRPQQRYQTRVTPPRRRQILLGNAAGKMTQNLATTLNSNSTT